MLRNTPHKTMGGLSLWKRGNLGFVGSINRDGVILTKITTSVANSIVTYVHLVCNGGRFQVTLRKNCFIS